ncbi:MAG: ADP-forming succinate--CoA ligase subunit beta [Bacteroidales bacterium]|jgi:succinyl-CoA synthetase beta subunit|nr:ADP-forming succinate--CoA ligase subunit beta [Bacteroidales bacterium]MDI9575309.1 ADP-forming succinate--CoA ligase subunit beta [Bacteroidota bacterium]MDY0400587.1 ADP-forming succinate--CoA ligase subunit beta [Bacteroidales bacterium]HHW59706.1 ADP-forming succinate--CoA ligase subunit beta [Bacteroidales bacterium]
MNLHEYQSKNILEQYGIRVAKRFLACNADEAFDAAMKLKEITGSDTCAIKAQVHAGGRGKAGGIKIAQSPKEAKELAAQIIGMRLITPQTNATGKLVKKVLVEQNLYYVGPDNVQEFYISISCDRRNEKNVILYSPMGGVDIEKIAEDSPNMIFKEFIDPVVGLMPFQTRKIAFNLGLSGDAFADMLDFITKLYRAYIDIDASLVEINPVLKTSDNLIYPADAKIVLEDSALFRHPDLKKLQDIEEENELELQACEAGLNYVKLDGNVACMVNGAGLAMATMDLIAIAGAKPANFLDIGGSASAEQIEKGFNIILKDPSVKAILINIFGGIVRCDRVAQGILKACKNLNKIDLPIIARIQGTNANMAKEILENSNLKILTANSLDDVIECIKKLNI